MYDQRHIEVLQEKDGMYSVHSDTKGYLPKGAKLDYQLYGILSRIAWVTIVPEHLIAMEHNEEDAA